MLCKTVHILAILVVVFADVAEVCRKGLNSQRTRDLPTFPLNDQPWRKHSERQKLDPFKLITVYLLAVQK